jgi:predicted RNase H-like HicB family nuclease
MKPAQRLTAIIEREGDAFVALCPEFDIASQGASIEEARANLIEAITLFFETADPSAVARRFHNEVFVMGNHSLPLGRTPERWLGRGPDLGP